MRRSQRQRRCKREFSHSLPLRFCIRRQQFFGWLSCAASC